MVSILHFYTESNSLKQGIGSAVACNIVMLTHALQIQSSQYFGTPSAQNSGEILS